jgi:hypothetical protein
MMTTSLLCPKCGGPLVKGGSMRGIQRYRCRPSKANPKACSWNGTQPAGLTEGPILHPPAGRFVITGAQNATPVNVPFLATLKTYCQLRKATLVVVPYRYKNPTSIWADKDKDDDWWAPELAPYMMDSRMQLGDHIVVLGDIKVQPTAVRPTSGLETIAGGKSAIVAHPKLELVVVPTPHHRLPKILTTTGVVTERNYISSKAGSKGAFHHTFGAAVVELSGSGAFHLRQLNATEDGSFHDMEYAYSASGRTESQAAALVLGDTHVKFRDHSVDGATFGLCGLKATLRPKHVVWHDLLDGYAANHHHKYALITNFVKHHLGHANIREELEEAFEYVDERTSPGDINVFPASNHHDWLSVWLERTDPRSDLENVVFWAETFKAVSATARMGPGGATSIMPFHYWAKELMRTAAQARLLSADESFTICGVEVGMHGHLGPNGARGAIRGFTKIGAKSVIGHSHTPGIMDGVYQVGTSSRLKLEYNKGPSSWLHTHCVIYANGKRSLINIVDGEYTA